MLWYIEVGGTTRNCRNSSRRGRFRKSRRSRVQACGRGSSPAVFCDRRVNASWRTAGSISASTVVGFGGSDRSGDFSAHIWCDGNRAITQGKYMAEIGTLQAIEERNQATFATSAVRKFPSTRYQMESIV